MNEIIVMPSALKHGLTKESLIEAWTNYVRKRPRGVDCWVAIGFDSEGIEIEMVGLVTMDGSILIIHGLSPATQKNKRELNLVR